MTKSNCKPETISIQADIIPFPISDSTRKQNRLNSNLKSIANAEEKLIDIKRGMIKHNIKSLEHYSNSISNLNTIVFGLEKLLCGLRR